jgi:type I restriction enzyme, S subunit
MLEGRWVIPRSWSWVQAKDISTIVGGGTPSTTDEANFSNQGIPWLTPSDLSNYKLPYVEGGKRDISQKGFQSSGARLLPKGTVLFTSRAPIGYCVISLNEITTNQGFKNLILDDKIRPEYIRYYLLDSKDYAESLASGSTFKEISGKKTGELKIPLPPLNEQRRIVSTIEQLTDRSNKARTALADVPKLIEQFRQSVLAAAFRGDLTADWREKNPDVEPASELLERIKIDRRKRWEEAELEKMKAQGKNPKDDKWKDKYRWTEVIPEEDLPEIPSKWVWIQFDQVIAMGPQNGFYLPRDKYGRGIPILRIDNFQDGWSNSSDELQLIDAIESDKVLYSLIKNDVVINRVNGT